MPEISERAQRVEVEVRVRVLDGRDRKLAEVSSFGHESIDAAGLRFWAERAEVGAADRAISAAEVATS